MPVDEESSKIQTMSTHKGTFRVKRLSFGITTAPSEFNQMIDQILRDCPKTENYFDVIVVHGSTKEECKNNLITCLEHLQKNELHINFKKCNFFFKSVSSI